METLDFSPHVVSAFKLLIFTGCRLGEILTLEWRFVDFEKKRMTLPDTKTGRRVVPLSDLAIETLENTPVMGEFVIRGRCSDKPRSDLKRPWKKLCSNASLDGLRIHDLRHTFASHGIEQGLSLHVVGKLLGHKSLETTARYAHLHDRSLRIALGVIGKKIKDQIE